MFAGIIEAHGLLPRKGKEDPISKSYNSPQLLFSDVTKEQARHQLLSLPFADITVWWVSRAPGPFVVPASQHPLARSPQDPGASLHVCYSLLAQDPLMLSLTWASVSIIQARTQVRRTQVLDKGHLSSWVCLRTCACVQCACACMCVFIYCFSWLPRTMWTICFTVQCKSLFSLGNSLMCLEIIENVLRCCSFR